MPADEQSEPTPAGREAPRQLIELGILDVPLVVFAFDEDVWRLIVSAQPVEEAGPSDIRVSDVNALAALMNPALNSRVRQRRRKQGSQEVLNCFLVGIGTSFAGRYVANGGQQFIPVRGHRFLART